MKKLPDHPRSLFSRWHRLREPADKLVAEEAQRLVLAGDLVVDGADVDVDVADDVAEGAAAGGGVERRAEGGGGGRACRSLRRMGGD